MKITDFEVYTVNIPLIKPYKVAFGIIEHATSIILKVHTDSNHVGWGEADPLLPFLPECAEGVPSILTKHILPSLKGMDPFNREEIHSRMNFAVEGNQFAKGAVDHACWDLMGKELGRPVYDLVGGKLRDRLQVMWPLGSGEPGPIAADAVAAVEKGYGTLMVKAGMGGEKQDIARTRAVREAVGDDVHLIVDANSGWNVNGALRVIDRIKEYDIEFLEQPVPKWDIEGMAKIARISPIPVCADEGLSSLHDAGNLVVRDAASVFSIKLGKNGGLTNAKKVAGLAQATGRNCFVNSMIELGIAVNASKHFLVSTPNIIDIGHALMSTNRLQDDILKNPIIIKDGWTDIPTGVGLGVEMDEAKLEDYSGKCKA